MFNTGETINGLYGHLYDENGKELASTQEFEAKVDLQKTAIKQAGVFMDAHKVTGGSGAGSVRYLMLDSRLQTKIAADPTAKYNYMGKLADPTAAGEEAVLFIGLSFDSIALMGYRLGEIVEKDVPFTFDNYRYVDSID